MKASIVEIVLPLRIESEANRREHWAVRASRTRQHRSTACLLVAPHRREILSLGCPVRITLIRIAPRQLDDDNLARGFKAVRDGIADGLGMDDRDRRIVWTYAQQRGTGYEAKIEAEKAAAGGNQSGNIPTGGLKC